VTATAPKAVPALAITDIADADVAAVIALWQACGLTRPWNDPASDIALARRGPHSTVLIGRDADEIVATAMVGHDGHRGWVYYLAVDPQHRGKDFGRSIMTAAEDWLRAQGLEKIMLMVRADNTGVRAFYDKLGYETQERLIYAKWLDGRPMTP
jgi:ribosomal protein S18 acetylase RimI-like enzyme